MAEGGEGGEAQGSSRGRMEEESILSLRAVPIVALGFVGMIEYSLVMPSLSEYVTILGKSHVFYGVSISAFSAVRLILMPLFGVWCDRRPLIEPLLLSLVFSILGNVLYGLAYGAHSAWLILIGRVLVGAGAANITVTTAYVARTTRPENRTRAMAMLNGINLFGIVIGPALNIFLNNIEFRITDLIVFNKYSNPGFIMVFFLVALMIFLLCTFEEPPKLASYSILAQDPNHGESLGSETLSSMSQLESPLISSHLSSQGDQTGSPQKRDIYRVLVKNKLWVHFFVSFASNFCLCELEVALPALTGVAFGWGTFENSVMYAVLGVSVALSLFMVVYLSGRFSDRALIGAGLVGDVVTLAFAMLILSDKKPNFAMFIIVVTMLIGFCPLCGSPNIGLYTKRLQEDEAATQHSRP